MSACPCCGFNSAKKTPAEIGKFLDLSKHERTMFDFLARNFNQMVTVDRLTDAVFALDASGGPVYTNTVLTVAARSLRAKIAPHGLLVEGISGRGGGRKMRWADGAK